MKRTCLIIAALLLAGCSEIKQTYMENIEPVIGAIEDPTERGLAYIAIAIIVSAIIRGLTNR